MSGSHLTGRQLHIQCLGPGQDIFHTQLHSKFVNVFEDLVGAKAREHERISLHVEDGTGHQQVQVGAWEPGPQHLG